MPRYSFHVRDGLSVEETDAEYSNDSAAKEQAVIYTSELIRELGADFWLLQEAWSLELRDESGVSIAGLQLINTAPSPGHERRH